MRPRSASLAILASAALIAGTLPPTPATATPQAPQPAHWLAEKVIWGHVAPVNWHRFRHGSPDDAAGKLAADILHNVNRYGLTTWFPKEFGDQTGRYLDLHGTSGDYIKPPSGEALALAVALTMGGYDADAVGVPRDSAEQIAVRLTASLAHGHLINQPAGGWGDEWQSAQWVYNVGLAGWLLWDRLPPDDRIQVQRMVVHEADRFIGYQVPYYADRSGKVLTPGDTKAEENAWNASLLQLAVSMLPAHQHRSLWLSKAIELMVSAYARPADLARDDVIAGRPVREWLNGSNVFDDGTLVNHSIIHPDYMTSITNNTSAAQVFSLAGLPAPEASLFNAGLEYSVLTDHQFASPPYATPGGTIYRRGDDGRAIADIYYPQGNDWGTSRQMHFATIDSEASLFGFAKPSDVPARDWAIAHMSRVLQMQSRFSDGRTYGGPTEDTNPSREEWVALLAARNYLTHWIAHQGTVRFSNDPVRTDVVTASVSVGQRGYLPPGTATPVTVTVTNTSTEPLLLIATDLALPAGWRSSPVGRPRVGWVKPGEQLSAAYNVTPPAATTPQSWRSVAGAVYLQDGHLRGSHMLASLPVPPPPPTADTWLSDHPWTSTAGAYTPRRDANNYGNPLAINGTQYEKGLWLDDATVVYYVGGKCTRFTADLGIDDAMNAYGANAGSVTYQVILDGMTAYQSGLVTGSSPTVGLDLDITGADELRLVSTDGGDGRRSDWADWGAARITCAA